jgi:hypothetical protein
MSNPASLKAFGKRMREMPVVLATRVAARAAGVLTSLAKADYVAGNTAYGDSRPDGVTLIDTGKTLSSLSFVAIGTLLRVSLSTPYAKYLIGKYRTLPNAGAPIPSKWSAALKRETQAEIDAYMVEQ